MKNTEIPRIGVVGIGFGRFLLKTLAAMDNVLPVAVADRNSSEGESMARSYGIRAYRQAGEMLEKEDLDGLVVAVSPRAREAIIKDAAERGIPMFVEKPWAASNSQAARLADLCQRTGAPVMTGFSFRYLPAVVRLQHLLNESLGPVRVLQAQYLGGWLPGPEAWLWDPGDGGGFFNENSCHLFDTVNAVVGEAPASLEARGGSFRNSPSPDAATVTILYPSGAVAGLVVGGIGVPAMQDFPRMEVWADQGQAILEGSGHIWKRLTWANRQDPAPHTADLPPESLGRTRYTDALEHFLACLRDNRPFHTSVREGALAVRMAMAVEESLETKQPVGLESIYGKDGR
jgi:predicted dehydrogenase